MFNSQMPTLSELPTSRQLLGSTGLALAAAAAILVAVVLPAEYGVDPTGIGRALQLTPMGEIKQQLAAEAAVEEAAAASPSSSNNSVATGSPAATVEVRSDRMELTLAPGDAAEIKVSAAKGTSVTFDWSVAGGNVNYDTHGDPVVKRRGFYHGYGKGKASSGENGVLVIAFDGTHGWYWRNRSAGTVTVKLNTRGAYTAIRRVV